MTTFALPVSAQANLRSKLRVQPGRSQNRFAMRGGKL